MFPGGRERVHLGTNRLTCYDLEIFKESAFTSFMISLFNPFHALRPNTSKYEVFSASNTGKYGSEKEFDQQFFPPSCKRKALIADMF